MDGSVSVINIDGRTLLLYTIQIRTWKYYLLIKMTNFMVIYVIWLVLFVSQFMQ